MTRAKAFFFHFNKPETMRAGYPRVSVHWDGQCFIVSNVVCNVPTRGRVRKTQPRFVMTGKAASMHIENDIAVLGDVQ